MKLYRRLWLYQTATGKVCVISKAGCLYIADSETEANAYAIQHLRADGILRGIINKSIRIWNEDGTSGVATGANK